MKTFCVPADCYRGNNCAFGCEEGSKPSRTAASTVKIAIPEFQQAAADAKTVALTSIFNQVFVRPVSSRCESAACFGSRSDHSRLKSKVPVRPVPSSAGRSNPL